jgi:hypothetical protein
MIVARQTTAGQRRRSHCEERRLLVGVAFRSIRAASRSRQRSCTTVANGTKALDDDERQKCLGQRWPS